MDLADSCLDQKPVAESRLVYASVKRVVDLVHARGMNALGMSFIHVITKQSTRKDTRKPALLHANMHTSMHTLPASEGGIAMPWIRG